MPIKEDVQTIVQPAFQSISVAVEVPMSIEPKIEPQAPIKKYYGRRREDQSSDEDMNVGDEHETLQEG